MSVIMLRQRFRQSVQSVFLGMVFTESVTNPTPAIMIVPTIFVKPIESVTPTIYEHLRVLCIECIMYCLYLLLYTYTILDFLVSRLIIIHIISVFRFPNCKNNTHN